MPEEDISPSVFKTGTMMVVIPREEYNKLLEESLMLAALQATGVNNWEGYGESQKLYKQYKKK